MSDFFDLPNLQNLLGADVTLQEAIEILCGNFNDYDRSRYASKPIDIFVEPPEPSILSPEDSGNEDDEPDMTHLPGKQLLAPAEVAIGNVRIYEESEPTASTSTNSVSPVSNSGNHLLNEWIKNRLEKGKPHPKWIVGDFCNSPIKNNFLEQNYSKYSGTPVEIFENYFFTADVWELLGSETERYASFKNTSNPAITTEEIKCFFGIMILSGYNCIPSIRDYWSQHADLHNDLVSEGMRKNRYTTILKYLHCADNSLMDPSDKAWKLRKFMNLIQEKFVENFVPSPDINYDESMVQYYGRHPMKQFIRGKPIRFGYKMWCLNSSDGYLINFDIYQGKMQKIPSAHAQLFGKAAAPLTKMLEDLPKEIQDLPYNIFLDNLFCGVNLFKYLKEKGYSATGTFRENRIPKADCKKPRANKRLNANKNKLIKNKGRKKTLKTTMKKTVKRNISLPTKAEWDKKERGAMANAIEWKDGINFIRWKDNGVVTVGSTHFGMSPTVSVKRYSSEQKKNITVQMPHAISKYNNSMGGTDLMDQNINAYRIGVRSKKWWWSIFTWVIDAAVQNSWILCKKNKKISQLQFRREIALYYLTRYAVMRKHPGPSGRFLSSSQVLEDIRFDRIDHFVTHTAQNKRRRCAEKSCTSKVRTMCKKCQVGLCIECFAPYHTA